MSESEEQINFFVDQISLNSHHYFITYLWNLVGEALEKREINIVKESIEIFDEYNDYAINPDGALVMRTSKFSEYSSNQVAEYYMRDNLFHIVIHRTIHPIIEFEKGRKTHKELLNEDIYYYVAQALPSLFREGANGLEEEIFSLIKNHIIEINELRTKYEILIKSLDIEMKTEIRNAFSIDEDVRMTYLSFDFLFELVNLTDLSPPSEGREGGKQYEKIKRETLIGK